MIFSYKNKNDEQPSTKKTANPTFRVSIVKFYINLVRRNGLVSPIYTNISLFSAKNLMLYFFVLAYRLFFGWQR